MEDRRAGIKDIANAANVSLATVDRVLHRRKGVSESTRKRVLEAIEELNFKPNIIASKLSLNKTYNIAVLLPFMIERNSFWGLHEKGLLKAKEELSNFNFNIEIFKYDQTKIGDFQQKALAIKESDIDGLILAPKFSGESKALIDDCKDRAIPVILIDSDLPDSKVSMKIGLPLFETGYTAASLFDYAIQEKKNILILHLVENISHQKHLLYKEEGFREYFLKDKSSEVKISTEVLTDYSEHLETKSAYCKYMDHLFAKYKDVNGVYVSNAKTGLIAEYLNHENRRDIFLIGHDLLEENAGYLENGTIDFLICQKPELQSYKAVYSLYDLLFREVEIPSALSLPIDIVCRANHLFYNNFN